MLSRRITELQKAARVYFQTLLIAKIVELLAHPTGGLTLEYFRRDEAYQSSGDLRMVDGQMARGVISPV